MNDTHLTNERMIDYIHGELAPADDVVVLAHLDTCEACRQALQTETHLTEALRAYGHETESDLPAGVVARIWDAVDYKPGVSWAERFAALLRPAIALPVAAALAVVVGITVTHAGSRQTTIDAAYYLEDHAALTKTVPFDESSSAAVPSSFQENDPGADQQWVATTDDTTVSMANETR